MRPLQEIVEEAQLVHQLECRGMNRIAAKIAQKIRVLFEDQHIHARARQQKSKHHSSRSAAGDAAAGLRGFKRGIV